MADDILLKVRTTPGEYLKIREPQVGAEILSMSADQRTVTLTNDDGSTIALHYADGRWTVEDDA